MFCMDRGRRVRPPSAVHAIAARHGRIRECRHVQKSGLFQETESQTMGPSHQSGEQKSAIVVSERSDEILSAGDDQSVWRLTVEVRVPSGSRLWL